MRKKLLTTFLIAYILFSIYLVLYLTISNNEFIKEILHIKNIYIIDILEFIEEYSKVWLSLIFFTIIFIEFNLNQEKKSLLLSNKFKEIILHFAIISSWIYTILLSMFIAFWSSPGGMRSPLQEHFSSIFLSINIFYFISFILFAMKRILMQKKIPK